MPFMADHLASDRPTAMLRLLGTSDVHMHLTSWDTRLDEEDQTRGLDRVATLIDAARADTDGLVLLFDNGDALQGTQMADLAMDTQSLGGSHPWPQVLRAMGYDAVGLGNHDFDYGLKPLAEICSKISVPVVSASPAKPLPHVDTHCILNRKVTCSDGQLRVVRIGVTSVLPPQTRIWNHAHLADVLDFRDGLHAARTGVEALRAEGVDLVVVLCHSGIATKAAQAQENFGLDLAREIPGIDAILLGHTHEHFPLPGESADLTGVDHNAGTLNGVPAAMPGYAGNSLAQIDLTLSYDSGVWHVVSGNVALHSAVDVPPHPKVQEIVAPLLSKTQAKARQRVGTTAHDMHSYFAMLQSGTVDALVASAMQDTIASAVNGSELEHLPCLAAVSPAAAGGRGGPRNFVNIPKGDILARHLSMIFPFQNAVWGHVMDGKTLRLYAEEGARFFGPNGDALPPLVASGAPVFNFDMLHGLETEVDPFAPPGQRIRTLAHRGNPIQNSDRFVVAMTGYRGAGGGGFPGTGVFAEVQTGISLKEALARYLTHTPMGSDPLPSVWRFAVERPRSVLIETSPKAEEHLDEIARFDPEPQGLTPSGFLQIKVTL